MPQATKILVIRFSAMGDVAMVAPVLKEFTEACPHIELLVVSRSLFKPFFRNIKNLGFHTFEPKQQHKGFLGLIKLFKELKAQNITAVADLHSNLRSRVLTLLFFFSGIRTVSVNKGRKEKKQLTRKTEKILIPLKLTVQRYAEVFYKLGFSFPLKNTLTGKSEELPHKHTLLLKTEKEHTGPEPLIISKTTKWIGVSPFAQHLQKVYPLHKMEAVILTLAGLGYQLFIFGGTEEEEKIADEWAAKHENIISLVRKTTLNEELDFIANLDIMVSMDSSGMHLASLQNIPVVSVWGATHPYAGFLGYGQSINDAVQLDLYCRPCSVYGNTPCFRGDFACMNNLPETIVVDKIISKLKAEEALS